MFTGLISDVGRVVDRRNTGDVRYEIACAYDPATIEIGASIACSGACLSVVERHSAPGGCVFAVEASAETLMKTTLGTWQSGTRVNLERSLRIGDELGGHLVSGHVDGVARIGSITPQGGSKRVVFDVPASLAPFIAPKGSIALDGTSFTVNEVSGTSFGINVIPHTLAVTTWGDAREGDTANVEIDMLARYVARLAQFRDNQR